MKTMRYRIRVITLLLIAALILVSLWSFRAVLFPGGEIFGKTISVLSEPSDSPAPTESSAPTPSPADSTQDPAGAWPPPESAAETGTPQPLFDTNGL